MGLLQYYHFVLFFICLLLSTKLSVTTQNGAFPRVSALVCACEWLNLDYAVARATVVSILAQGPQ